MNENTEYFVSRARMSSVIRVGLLGGQCCGKSRIIEAAKGPLYQAQIHPLMEAARTVRDATGFRAEMGNQGEVIAFQKWLFELQCMHEAFAVIQAERERRTVVLCDRPTFSGFAYLGFDEYSRAVGVFERLCQVSLAECINSYEAIIYLEMPSREEYGCRKGRSCSYDVALQRAEMYRRVIEGCERVHVIPWAAEKEAKIAEVLRLVASLRKTM